MKKIGILFGQERTFPEAFIKRINDKNIKGITAEFVSIDKVVQGETTEYAVIVDRISQDVPFYRAYLKNAAIGGTAVINNPFWWSADEKFFNNALALSVGVAVPKTVLLPSHARPENTDEKSFKNLKFPHNWDSIFEYIGFPAYMKPHSGGGWKSVYQVKDAQDLFEKHAETDQLVMMLQEEIVFTEYFRCYSLGDGNVHIMQYEPRNPHHLRYVKDGPPIAKAILDKVREGVIRLNKALGYDFNTVEFAVRDGIPYAIDFCNPAPDADVNSVGEENFEWIVENAANMCIERAKAQKPGEMNLTWGTFIRDQVSADANLTGKRELKSGAKAAEKKNVVSKPARKAKATAEKITASKLAEKPKATKMSAAPKPSSTKVKMTTKLIATPKRMMAQETGTAEAIKRATAKKSQADKKAAAKKASAKKSKSKKEPKATSKSVGAVEGKN